MKIIDHLLFPIFLLAPAGIRWWRALELPTWLLVLVVYGAWLALTGYGEQLPWFVLPLGGVLVCLHGSLQHELIHGHPSADRRLNTLLGFWPLGLWTPYRCYYESHIEHHRTEQLTAPGYDPESFYLSPGQWVHTGGFTRALLIFNNTLCGRLLIGPIIVVTRFWSGELRRLLSGDRSHLGVWAMHGLGVVVVLWWVLVVGGLSWWQYLLFFVWPGLSLTLLRSFYEHRPAPEQAARTAVIEGAWPWRLLFLNNNYHALHHEQPRLPWYELHRVYRAQRERILAGNSRFLINGYRQLLRYWLRPKDLPVSG